MNQVTQRAIIAATSRNMATTADYFGGTIRKRHKKPSYLRTVPPVTPTGGRFTVTMVPGIGAGPQMMKQLMKVFEAAGAPIDFEVIEDIKATKNIISSIKRNGVAIKGHIPELPDHASNTTLRTLLDLYTYKVHIRSYPNVRSKIDNLDVYVFRQNIEGEYAMLEHSPKPGIVESLKIITRETTERFAYWAYGFARKHMRKKITIIHKANIMKLADGLFLKTIQHIGKEFPDIKTENMIVDNCSMQIVKDPHAFDVLLTPNLYGNIVISIFCGLIGGHGLISGENISDDNAVFEVGLRHIALQDPVYFNPIAMLNAGVEMLLYLKKDAYANLIAEAVYSTLVEDKCHTPDLGGEATSSDVVNNVICRMKETLNREPLPSIFL
ncbi:unnamed protein product [Phyllotreta striolata]|uniref:Isopropylmalate dehydrogenase-like domain-containing protein n=1 Tax=Phyllotreta striolata TaxID=444603 RepID=A0A9N9XR46_PHYSR|nr:unnamed protein product [Phyllotreta striolata]